MLPRRGMSAYFKRKLVKLGLWIARLGGWQEPIFVPTPCPLEHVVEAQGTAEPVEEKPQHIMVKSVNQPPPARLGMQGLSRL